ncbi:MAG TPA: serine/threonine-protein kinase [Kofleriaceae bacterium]|nr:serine/threonine-protein kinase [Kofleriaceae bacterium]
MPADGGIRFGQYVLLRRIARGGMAEVFLAQQRGLEGFDRRVAVKRILPHLVDSPDFVKMFLGEAKLAAQLAHPNIVHIYDFGKVDGDYFIAMEYVDGVHAGQLFKQNERLPATLVARLGADAASALHYAHDLRGPSGAPLGLVHRDVSPANLMVSYDGVVKLCDFGIAKAAALTDQKTNPGQVKGKYAYMSPEQTVASQLDGRSDVFSLAIVLWELLAGRFMVERGDALDAMRAIRDGKLEPIARTAPRVPPPLADALARALRTKRDERATAAELAQALEAYIKSSPELGTAMELGAWVRARFAREATHNLPALAPPGGSTAVAAGTQVAPGTMIASGMQSPITPPQVGGASRPSFGADLDEEAADTLRRGTPVRGAPTVVDLAARAAAESTLRDRSGTAAMPDVTEILSETLGRDPAPPPAPAPRPPTHDSAGRPRVVHPASVVLPAGNESPRARLETGQRRRATQAGGADRKRRRRLRLAAAISGLAGLALVSFALALAATGGSHPRAAPVPDARAIAPAPGDAAPLAAVPADATPAIVVEPLPDAGPAIAYLEIRTIPDGGTVKVGDQSRIATAQLVVEAGHHAVTAELAGYAPEHRSVDILPGEHQRIEIAFTHKLSRPSAGERPPTTGKLTLRTEPYSDVYEGGRKIGETPFAELELAAGVHTLTFKNPKHPTLTKKITIVAGKTTKLGFDLP